MRTRKTDWPQKQRELQNHHIDSTRWNEFQFRDDDIVVATYAKSGTTWLQQILGQLIFDAAEHLPVMDISPWIDLRVLPADEIDAAVTSQTHRRFLKTHLPVDALVYSPKAKYIYIARDGRDTLWSWYNHHSGYSETAYQLFNDTPGRVGPPSERPNPNVIEYFHEWLDRDGFTIWSYFSHIQSWWDIRHLPNMLLIHFKELKADLPRKIRDIAQFLEIEINEDIFPDIVEHSSFDYMKTNADDLTPLLSQVFDNGASHFINRGSNARWIDVLSDADIDKYLRIASEKLSPDCAAWLGSEYE